MIIGHRYNRTMVIGWYGITRIMIKMIMSISWLIEIGKIRLMMIGISRYWKMIRLER